MVQVIAIKVTGHPFWRFAENRYCTLNISSSKKLCSEIFVYFVIPLIWRFLWRLQYISELFEWIALYYSNIQNLKKAEHNFETDVFSYVLWKFEKNWLKPAGEELVWKSVITVKFFWRKLNLNITFSMFFLLQRNVFY
jgi:hypothetical protein